MKNKVKLLSIIAVSLVVFVIGEQWLRTFTRVNIPISISTETKVEAKAFKQSDFLWSGTAWWIDLNTTQEIELIINSEWSGKVPKGQHKIYYNHDHSNTDKYSQFYSKVPKTITIKETLTKRSTE